MVHALNVVLLENTTMGRFFLQTLFAVAELERNLIIERPQEGKAITKQRDDFREGRPNKYTPKQIEHTLELLETHLYTQLGQLTGIKYEYIDSSKEKAAIIMTRRNIHGLYNS